jgi:hypothetical protein
MHIMVLIEVLAQVFFIHHAITTHKPRYWVLILLVPWVGFLIYLLTEFTTDSSMNRNTDDNIDKIHISAPPRNHLLAYIAQGKLFQISDDSPAEQIQSPFGQKIVDQTIRIHQKNGWKMQGSGSHFGGAMLWGVDQVDGDAIKVNITSVARCSGDTHLHYILETDSAGGLFAYNHTTKEERRLFHKERFKAKDLDIHLETKEFVCSQQFANGTSNLLLISQDGNDLREITEGDSIDDSPSWIPGKHRRILFQSTGIARNRQGYAVGRGATSIQALDLDSNLMTTVLEDGRYDFLQPHIGVDGYLYYIRRPYESNRYRPETAILDFFLFPFRLLRALFHYLNFFSLVYSRKPLTTAAGPKLQRDDMKTVILNGKIIDAEKALRAGARIMGVPCLVPASWELIRRDEHSREAVIAKHVASFDISQDGSVIYSNGYGIFGLDFKDGQKLLLRDKLIEDIMIG